MVELKKLSLKDGNDIHEMLQTMPADENGFINPCKGKTFEEYKAWLAEQDNFSKGIYMPDWMVVQDIYWLYVDEKPAGMGKLRHSLTEALKKDGGHCGYGIAPAFRGKGHGKTLLKLLAQKAKLLGIGHMLVTIDNHNAASVGVALGCGGVVDKITDTKHYIWIDTSNANQWLKSQYPL